MKKLLVLSALLLCSCGSKQEASYKQQFYDYLENNLSYQVITVDFRLTEAHTFGYDYYAVDVYYTDGELHKCEYVIAVENNNIIQIGEVK